jgi:regulator of RNase E activity RraA
MTEQPVTGDAALLALLDTCALSDALDVLGMEGVVSGPVALREGARLAGPAVTVKLALGSPGNGQDRVTGGRRPGTVLADGEDKRP